MPPDQLPPEVDERQPSLFAAGWTVGSIRHLAAAGAASLTYYETTGWRGVLERGDHPLRVSAFASRPGMIFPLYHVLADVAEFAGGELLPVEVSDPLAVEALALRSGGRVRVIVASFVDEPRTVSLSLPSLTALTVRRLDESNFAQSTGDATSFRARHASLTTEASGGLELDLLPFAVATVDGRMTG